MFGLAKRWLLGSHHGVVSIKHLPDYLEELVVRFNRRTAKSLSHRFKPAWPQDVVQVAPDKYEVLLENDQVRVLEFRDQPGDKIPMHSHPDYVVYFLKPMERRFSMPDGRTVDAKAQAGEARWLKAVTHAEENIGSEGAGVLIIELKGQGG